MAPVLNPFQSLRSLLAPSCRAITQRAFRDYLEVFKGFTLTVCGLGMDSKRLYPDFESDVSMGSAGSDRGWSEMRACTSDCEPQWPLVTSSSEFSNKSSVKEGLACSQAVAAPSSRMLGPSLAHSF
eukprot:713453-Pelagomonas_calceolata.AAC.5